jgi:hypothetical protein
MASSSGEKRAAMTSKTLVWTVEALQWKSTRGECRCFRPATYYGEYPK